MTCLQAEPLLARAADGTLDAERAAVLAGHLDACADCREALETQSAARALVAARSELPVPAGFAARVLAALPERHTPAAGWLDALNWRAWTLRLAPVAGALFVGAALGAAPADQATPAGAVDFSELAAAWAADEGGTAAAGEGSGAPLDTVARLWQEAEVTDGVLLDLLSANPE